MEITYTIRCEPEDRDYRKEGFDREAVEWIAENLARGNAWAWCWVLVEASIELDGETFVGSASLGGCNYESEALFREDPYFSDLKDEARDALLTTLRQSGKRGRIAARALKSLEAK